MTAAASITLRNLWFLPIEGYIHGAMGLVIIFMMMSPLLSLLAAIPKDDSQADAPPPPKFKPED